MGFAENVHQYPGLFKGKSLILAMGDERAPFVMVSSILNNPNIIIIILLLISSLLLLCQLWLCLWHMEMTSPPSCNIPARGDVWKRGLA